MAQHHFAALALAFLGLALTACASTEQRAPHPPFYKGNGIAEFHQASIGGDALRGELPSEN